MSKPRDDNDLLLAGELPLDPFEGLVRVPAKAKEGAEVLGSPEPLRATLRESIARARRRAPGGPEKPVPMPEGWCDLAAFLGSGLWPGCHVLVGSTGSGKSQFAMQLAVEAVFNHVPVLYVGLELDSLGIDMRFGAVALRHPRPDGTVDLHRHKWSEMYLGEDTDALDALEARADELGDLPFHKELENPYGWPHGRLAELATWFRQKYPEPETGTRPGLVIIDFLQLVTSDEEREELRRTIQRAAYAARQVARSHNLTVLLLSSTARENVAALEGETTILKGKNSVKVPPFGEGNPARFVGTGKESGEVETSADTVLVLGRRKWEDGEPPQGHTHTIGVAKCRARSKHAPKGNPGWFPFYFDGTAFAPAKPEKPATGPNDAEGVFTA
jgi:hypothetical protein